MKEDKFKLEPIWQGILAVYQEVAKICQRHNLRYYVTDGTLIGAIRHHGFIPWDDDFDMSMPREDYEKFVEIAQKELPTWLKFVNWKNTPEFPFLFGKVQDCRREVLDKISETSGRRLSNGIYVDIFPIDGYPRSKWRFRYIDLWTRALMLVWRFRFTPMSRHSTKGKVGWLLGGVLQFLVPWIITSRQIHGRCEKLVREVAFAGSKMSMRPDIYVTGITGKPIPSDYWGVPIPCQFCETTVPVPQKYDQLLRQRFGDYMQLPPASCQQPTHEYAWDCAWKYGPTCGS